ncbi:MAG: hypothetical protein AAF585_15885 [Verrucomicrobiota bacterium]
MDSSTLKALQIIRDSKRRLTTTELKRFFSDIRQLPESELLEAYSPKKTKAKKTPAKKQSPVEKRVRAEVKKSKLAVADFIGFMIARLDSKVKVAAKKWTLGSFVQRLQDAMSDDEIVQLAIRVTREESFAYDA